VTLVAANRADFVTTDVRDGLRDDLGERLTEVALDAGHMLFWDAPAEVGAILRGALA
jgi:hypothetical protein